MFFHSLKWIHIKFNCRDFNVLFRVGLELHHCLGSLRRMALFTPSLMQGQASPQRRQTPIPGKREGESSIPTRGEQAIRMHNMEGQDTQLHESLIFGVVKCRNVLIFSSIEVDGCRNRNASLLYVDNPVGAGFSYTSNFNGYPNFVNQSSEDLYMALQQFFTIWSDYAQRYVFMEYNVCIIVM